MPGPTSDSYDPEWGTGANAEPITDALETLYDRVSGVLGGQEPIDIRLIEESLTFLTVGEPFGADQLQRGIADGFLVGGERLRGEGERESAAVSGLALNFDGALMQFNELLRKRQRLQAAAGVDRMAASRIPGSCCRSSTCSARRPRRG